MRFEYKPYVDQSVGTIAELMLRSGQLQADQLQRAAQIAANAQREAGGAEANAQWQRGQIVGQSIGDITRALGSIPGAIQDAKRTKLAEQEIGLRMDKAQREADLFKQQQNDEYLIDRAASPHAQGGGPNDAEYAPPPAAPGPPVVPTPTPGLSPQTLPGSLGAMVAGPGGVPSAGPPSPAPPPVAPPPQPAPHNPNVQVAPTRDQVLEALPWRLQQKVASQFAAADKNKTELLTMQEALAEKHREALGGLGVSVAEHNYDQMAFNMAVDAAEAQGTITPEQKQDYKARGADEGQRRIITDQVIDASKTGRDWRKDNQPEYVMGSPGSTPVNKRTGALGQTIPKDPADYTLGDSRYSGATNQPIATNEVMRQHQAETAAASRLRAGNAAQTAADQKADAKLMMDGIEAGRLPPLLPGRASPQYIALSAEAERRGFNLAGAVTDWVATQAHIKTLNNGQQTRLRQAIGQLPELLDSVQALADKWDAGHYPALNTLALKAAQQGGSSEEAASLARQLETQIADVVSDLAVVYQGGNSPTDEALRLAKTALAGNWSRKTLTDMVALAKKNVKTRNNSINNVGVAGASDDNPYAPNAQPAAPPPGTPPTAPPGWKYVPKPGGGWTAVEAK